MKNLSLSIILVAFFATAAFGQTETEEINWQVAYIVLKNDSLANTAILNLECGGKSEEKILYLLEIRYALGVDVAGIGRVPFKKFPWINMEKKEMDAFGLSKNCGSTEKSFCIPRIYRLPSESEILDKDFKIIGKYIIVNEYDSEILFYGNHCSIKKSTLIAECSFFLLKEIYSKKETGLGNILLRKSH